VDLARPIIELLLLVPRREARTLIISLPTYAEERGLSFAGTLIILLTNAEKNIQPRVTPSIGRCFRVVSTV